MTSTKLTVGMYGREVNSLHTELLKQGFQIPESEVKQGFFGPGTRQAVAGFQKSHGIKATCEVCEKTAAQLAVPPTATPAGSGSDATRKPVRDEQGLQ